MSASAQRFCLVGDMILRDPCQAGKDRQSALLLCPHLLSAAYGGVSGVYAITKNPRRGSPVDCVRRIPSLGLVKFMVR